MLLVHKKRAELVDIVFKIKLIKFSNLCMKLLIRGGGECAPIFTINLIVSNT
jgi:hypothetical protein